VAQWRRELGPRALLSQHSDANLSGSDKLVNKLSIYISKVDKEHLAWRNVAIQTTRWFEKMWNKVSALAAAHEQQMTQCQ
jgi:hypothetical protein